MPVNFKNRSTIPLNVPRGHENAIYANFEEIGIPSEDIGKSYQFYKSTMSDPSEIIREINVPEVLDLESNFVYNYYLRDERISFQISNLSLDKIPRYVSLKWTVPSFSQLTQDTSNSESNNESMSISSNSEKIISEDNFFNPGYVSHTFSNVSAIEQGSTDLENYSRMSRHDAESVFKMSKKQIQEIANLYSSDDPSFKYIKGLTDSYSRLADMPKTSLGLSIFDKEGNPNDEDDLMSSISNSISLNVKISNAIVPDVFKDSKVKKDKDNLEKLNISYGDSLRVIRAENLQIQSIKNDCSKTSLLNLSQPVKMIGFIVDRYLTTADGIVKDETFYIENFEKTSFEDKSVLYGRSYIYSVRTVASVKLMSYDVQGNIVDVSTVYVGSRPVSVPVECYEYKPPPEPNNIRFTFDYVKRSLVIHWDTPVNPQRDIKQFQIFRRKTIKEPFELIAQYGFDKSKFGPGTQRYKTGERVDANNFENMKEEDKYLVTRQDDSSSAERSIYTHIDEDFTVDPEFYISSEYIYALSSVDAHGMISNYSSQHHVVFDSYKNKIVTKVVCDAGSPRQYPNMKLNTDAFKDTIRVSGDSSRQMKVYFTPEYLKVREDRDMVYKIVEAKTQRSDSYYVLQMINLDNQKTQQLKINILDPKGLTE
jgi:hypothetical protein